MFVLNKMRSILIRQCQIPLPLPTQTISESYPQAVDKWGLSPPLDLRVD